MKRFPILSALAMVMLLVGSGILWYAQIKRSIARYIPEDPVWVYQSPSLHAPTFDSTLQNAANTAKKWSNLTEAKTGYWYASGHQNDAQSPTFLLFLALPQTERDVIALIGGKMAKRAYHGYDILTFHREKLHAARVSKGWLVSPSVLLLEQALDGATYSFDAMPLHPENQFTALYMSPKWASSKLSVLPWNDSGVYYFRENQNHADRSAPLVMASWQGQTPGKITTWALVPDFLSRLDFWKISSIEAWKSTHPEWQSDWHFLFPKSGGEVWQFFPKGDSSIVWLPIQDPKAVSFLSGGQSDQAGIYPLALPKIAQKILGEPIDDHHYFCQMAGGIALSASYRALEWYQTKLKATFSIRKNQHFNQEIFPALLPRQSRLTLTFPPEGPSFLTWEGIQVDPDQPVTRLSWGKALGRTTQAQWTDQGKRTTPPTPQAVAKIHQDANGFWWIGPRRTRLRSPVQPYTWATWHPKEGIWLGQAKAQTLYHVNTKRTFSFSGDSPLVGLVQQRSGKTSALTRFGQLIPLDPTVGLLPKQTLQLERVSKLTQFRALESVNRQFCIIRDDPSGLTWFDAAAEKGVSIPNPSTPWKLLTYEVLPNNLQLLVLFDGQSHYLYTRDGTWLGQKSLLGEGPLHIRFDASNRKLSVYTKQDQTWNLWALGPIDD